MVLIDRKEHDISGANVQQAIQMYKLTFLRKFAILIKSKDIDGGFEQIRSDIFYALCRKISDLFFLPVFGVASCIEICHDIENRYAASV